jgi:hypothetical protein
MALKETPGKEIPGKEIPGERWDAVAASRLH